jgi:hypothetical protein
VALKTIQSMHETGKFRELVATSPYLLRTQIIDARNEGERRPEVSHSHPRPSRCGLSPRLRCEGGGSAHSESKWLGLTF